MLLHVLRKYLTNSFVVMTVYCLNSGLGTSLYRNSTTISNNTEQIIIVYSHLIFKFSTNKFAIKNPTIFPALDLDDHTPTILPSSLTLNWLLNIVKVAGKKLNWKNPNTPKLPAIRMWFRTVPYSSNSVSLNNDMTGMTVNPMMVGMAVQTQASTGLLELMIEYLKKVPNARVR